MRPDADRIRCNGMLQQFFKRVFRMAEHKSAYSASLQRSSLQGEVRPREEMDPSSAFLAQILRSALAQKHVQNRGEGALHGPSSEPSVEFPHPDAEQPDGKVIRLVPRSQPRPAPERVHVPSRPDDNDPGPNAA